ncbi:uncharacterized protein [Primulina eburnea]|uniref:uncharacterized protein n=1 Tax=Primulina eburnea TaxID=1245227 RepID=UPI003C6C8D16
MSKRSIIDYFIQKNNEQLSKTSNDHLPSSSRSTLKTKKLKPDNEVALDPLEGNNPYYERDPGKRIRIWEYPCDKQDDVRREFVGMRPYQPIYEYPLVDFKHQKRSFQSSWFVKFPWLEFSKIKESAFCFPCYLFDVPSSYQKKFTVEGFKNWKRVNCKTCPLKRHEGDCNSLHSTAMQKWEGLKNVSQHIDRRMNKQSENIVKQNRLLIKTSIRAVRWLALQGCAFRGHDESVDSHNRGNFLELVKFQGELSKEIGDIVLDKASKNAKYTSPSIQQEILKIIADLVRSKIRDEVGDAKLCILVDEAVDESHRSQMAIVLRYVDCDGFVRERFFEVVGVDDTNSLTLKTHICSILTQHKLLIENMRGQGYDGASNMRGEWNGLQALFLKDCPHSQLKSIRENEIIDLIESGELGTGTGVNQASTLQRPASTRWSSHYAFVCRVIELFGSVCTLLKDFMGGKSAFSIRAEAKSLLKEMMTFDFVFILLLMHRVLEAFDMLCQALQRKNQDILNAMSLVMTTKLLFQKMRDDEWEDFLWSVNNFCDNHDIVVPDLTARYVEGTKRSCQQKNHFTVEEYYHFHVFNVVIDKQLMELNTRFTEQSIELLTLCEALNPSDGFKSFSESAIYSLIDKFYPNDFSKDDMKHLKTQLDHYKLDVFEDPRFKDVDSLPKLCRLLVETKKSRIYFIIDRLIRLVLTLPVSTATTERAFSGMKLLKTPLRNKMEQEYLNNAMVLYIEREIAHDIDIDYIIDRFDLLKNRRLRLK